MAQRLAIIPIPVRIRSDSFDLSNKNFNGQPFNRKKRSCVHENLKL